MSTYPQPNAGDFEPDDEWKRGLKTRLKLRTDALITDAKTRKIDQLRTASSFEDRKWVTDEFNKTRQETMKLEKEQYVTELEKERKQRRWIAEHPEYLAKSKEKAEDDAQKRNLETRIWDRMTPKASFDKLKGMTSQIQSQLLEKERLEKELLKVQLEAEAKKEEARRQAKEAHMKMELTKLKEAEVKKKEMEIMQRERDAKKRSDEARKLEDYAKRKEIELRSKEEEIRQRDETLRKQAEEMKEEVEKIAAREEMRILLIEAEAHKKAEDIQVRERYLQLRELDFRRREEDAKKDAEMRHEEDIARTEKAQVDPQMAEESHQGDAAALGQIDEDAREVEQGLAVDQMDENEMIAEATRRSQDTGYSVLNLNDNILGDLAVQTKRQEQILQQLKFERRAKEILRKRQEERSRKESFSDSKNLGSPSTPSSPESQLPSLFTSSSTTGTESSTSSIHATSTPVWPPIVAPHTSSEGLLKPPSATQVPYQPLRASSASSLRVQKLSLQSTPVPSPITGAPSTDIRNGAFATWSPISVARSISSDATLKAFGASLAGVSGPLHASTNSAHKTTDDSFPDKVFGAKSVGLGSDRFGAASHTIPNVPIKSHQLRQHNLSIDQRERFRREQENLDAKAASHPPAPAIHSSFTGPLPQPNDAQVPSVPSLLGSGPSKSSPQPTRRQPLVITDDLASSSEASHAIWVKSAKSIRVADGAQETAAAENHGKEGERRWKAKALPKVSKVSQWGYEYPLKDSSGSMEPLTQEKREHLAAFGGRMKESGHVNMASEQRKETANRRKHVDKRKGPGVTIEDVPDEDMDDHRGGTLPNDSRVLFEKASDTRGPGDA